MANDRPKNGWAIIIHTDKYAGNFERNMTAFITGQVGDCDVGREYIQEWSHEMFGDAVLHVPDEHGCYRPTTIWDSGGGYNSVAIFFDEEPAEDLIKEIKERAELFPGVYKSVEGAYSWNKEPPELEILGFSKAEFISGIIETKI